MVSNHWICYHPFHRFCDSPLTRTRDMSKNDGSNTVPIDFMPQLIKGNFEGRGAQSGAPMQFRSIKDETSIVILESEAQDGKSLQRTSFPTNIISERISCERTAAAAVVASCFSWGSRECRKRKNHCHR